MARVLIAATADEDVSEILTYLAAEAGMRVAAAYLERFDALYDHLAAYPQSGAPRPRLGQQIRIGIVSPYIVVYRYAKADDTVFIQRVLHGRRRITGKLLRKDAP